MRRPSLTVLLPVKHYQPRYLQESIASIYRQTAEDWRLLVIVEDEQHDQLAALLGDSLTDSRTQIVVNRGRKLAGAINTGMRYACTPFVALLLGDDLWASTAVEVLTGNIHAHADTDFFHSARRIIDENGAPISGVYPSRRSFSVEDFKKTSPVKHLLCWRASFALALGGLDETLNSVGPDDYDFPWTMAENNARFKAIEDCLYYYRDHRDAYRLTTHLPLSVHRRECLRIFKKHGVGWRERRRYVARAQRSFLRQCLYRNALDRWLKERIGFDGRRGWREAYR